MWADVIDVFPELPSVDVDLNTEVGRDVARCDRKSNGYIDARRDVRIERGPVKVDSGAFHAGQRVSVRPGRIWEARKMCSNTFSI